MRTIVSRLALLSVVAALLLLAQPASSQSDITITDLGPVCEYCGPVDLNSQGQVVGWDAPSSSVTVQFLWTPENGRKDLTDLGWQFYVYNNDRGQVVATSWIYPQALQPVLVEGDEESALGDLGGGYAIPHDINEVGHVVGESSNSDHKLHAFLWTPQQGKMQDLGTLSGGNYARALAANDLGWVVGEAATAVGQGEAVGYEMHAFLWTPQQGMKDLGTLGGTSSIALGINNLGQVVGNSSIATGESYAFLWTAEGGMRDLGSLGGNFTGAFDINELGHVVGWSNTSSGETHAFLWTPEGGMQDLGTFDGVKSAAICINDRDHIAGIRWL
ncbi:MAG: HAF repeat-containing protein, partial [Anaerolineae bacterium]|nr:HAF repeat-containing protein [Anaerolineae bacterium]NIN97528.1 HAF repeat-containing protein [Anaerolineae bacterium]NIQ80456.1 HAF repeat-containing protein [Anaerolineae bacterium]